MNLALVSGGGGGGTGPRVKPTREQIRNVQANFCNLTDMHGRVIFAPFIMSLGLEDREDWYARMRAAGATHITLAVRYFYHSSENIYPIPGKDWRSDLPGWVALVWEAIDHGFIPEIALTEGDGDFADPNSQTQWFMRHGVELMRQIRAAGDDLTEWCLWRYGWEPDPVSCQSCIPKLREACGPTAAIALHLQVDYVDPSGDGNAFWNDPAIIAAAVDVFLYQNKECDPPALDEYGQPLWENSAVQNADRLLPTGTPMPGARGHLYYDKPSNSTKSHPGVAQGPFYMGPSNPTVIFFEVAAYHYIRHHFGDGYVQQVAHRAQAFGFTKFGNGVPMPAAYLAQVGAGARLARGGDPPAARQRGL